MDHTKAIHTKRYFVISKLLLSFLVITMVAIVTLRYALADEVVTLFEQSANIGTVVQATADVAVGDVDHDGDLDVFVANNYWHSGEFLKSGESQDFLYLNDGFGNLLDEHAIQIERSLPSSAAEFGDLNNDGYLDLVIGHAFYKTKPNTTTLISDLAQNAIYFGDGNGEFTRGYTFTVKDNTTSIVLADMNGDQALDVVVGNYNEENYIYFNNGVGDFSIIEPLTIPGANATTSIAVGDVDADGDLDLLVGNFEQPSLLYANSGTDSMTMVISVTLPASRTNAVAIANIDGVNGPELLTGNLYEENLIYKHLGNGYKVNEQFSTSTFSTVTYPTRGLLVTDLNGDRKLDIVVSHDVYPASGCDHNGGKLCYRASMYYENNGVGQFPTVVELPSSIQRPATVAAGDMNNDGLIDIIEGTFVGLNAISFNSGKSLFPSALQYDFNDDKDNSQTSFVSAFAVGDFDGANGLDVLVTNASSTDPNGEPTSGKNKVYLNDGGGHFTKTGVQFGEAGNTRAVVIGQLDKNNSLDVVIANRVTINNLNFGEVKVYTNTKDIDSPNLAFAAASPVKLIEGSTPEVLALGDLDADGDLDLVAVGGGENGLYFNDGDAHFSEGITFSVGSEWSWGLALGDMDGDGDLDIVVGNQIGGGDAQNRVYYNDGFAHFATHRDLGSHANDTRSIAVGDINGDGHLDIIEGNEKQQNWIYVNDGTGHKFSLVLFGPGNDITNSIAVANLNQDRFLDLLYTLPKGFYLNNGLGLATFLNYVEIENTSSAGMLIADVDQDGYGDLILSEPNSGRPDRIWPHAKTTSAVVIT